MFIHLIPFQYPVNENLPEYVSRFLILLTDMFFKSSILAKLCIFLTVSHQEYHLKDILRYCVSSRVIQIFMKISEHVPLILIFYSYGSNICDYKPTSRESLHGASSNTPSSASFDILSIIADLP